MPSVIMIIEDEPVVGRNPSESDATDTTLVDVTTKSESPLTVEGVTVEGLDTVPDGFVVPPVERVVVGPTAVDPPDATVVVGATVVVVVVVVGASVVVVVATVVVDAWAVVVPVPAIVVVGATVVVVVVVGPTVVVVVGGTVDLQNSTCETAGRFSLPTRGNPEFENEPLYWAGLSEYSTASGPPLTTTTEIATVDVQSPPVAVPLVIVTMLSFPAGFSNT